MLDERGSGGRLDRRGFLKTIGAGTVATALLGALGCRSAARVKSQPIARKRASRPPNIVLVLVDDLGWTDLGCTGSAYYETPNIDRLASQGMMFTDAYAACAVCSPTRAAVLTGRYPARIGVTNVISPRDRGGRMPAPGEIWPDYVDASGNGSDRLLSPRNPYWMEREEVTIAEALKPAGYVSCHVGKWHLGLDQWYPERQGFQENYGGCDYGYPGSYFDPYWHENRSYIPTLPPRRTGEYLTDREADEAAGFITRNRSRPFFLYMAHYAVHMPLEAKAEVVAKYADKPATRHRNETYAAMVQGVDSAVGRILRTLDELGLRDDTLVIFTSDNGGLSAYEHVQGPTDNHPLRAGKGYPYEGGIRVPAIIRWPGVVAPGSVCREPIISPDYFPTILAAARQDPPANRIIDGESLVPLLTQTGSLDRDAIFWHFPHYRGQEGEVPYSIVRCGDWKLIKRYEGKTFELYNLRNDICETTELSDRMPGKVAELDARLTGWLKRTGAKLPIRNPNYVERAVVQGVPAGSLVARDERGSCDRRAPDWPVRQARRSE